MINIVLLYLNRISPIIILGYIIYVDYNINVASGLMQDVLVFFFFHFLREISKISIVLTLILLIVFIFYFSNLFSSS